MWGHSRLDVGLPHRQAELFSAVTPRGVVVFVHGDVSNRHSWRSTEVAQALQRRGLNALLVDLLSDKEADTRQLAAFVLGNINPNPQSVVAALKMAATKDESELVRRSAGEALKKIDPVAAANAGIQ